MWHAQLGQVVRRLFLTMSEHDQLFPLTHFFIAGVRNYLKEALVNIIAVHAEVRQHPVIHSNFKFI